MLVGGVERRGAGALVEPAGTHDGLDDLVRSRVRVVDVDVDVRDVQLVVVDDRSDAGPSAAPSGP